MNLWARILGLVFLPALLITACERDDLAIGLPPKDSTFGMVYYEHVLTPFNMQEDSIVSSGTGRILMGNFDDPVFGPVTAYGYTSVDASTPTRPPVEVGATADSLVLTMRANYVYGDTDIDLDLAVYLLTFILNDTTNYQSSFEWPLPLPNQVGSIVYDFPDQTYQNDSLVVLQTVLDNDFANKLLDSLEVSTTNFEIPGEFKKIFSGLAFLPQGQNDGIIGVDVDNAETKLTLYFTDVDGDKGSWDMLLSPVEHYSYITPNGADFDRTGTALENLMFSHTDHDPSDNYIYYQGGTGLGITADASSLLGLADSLQNTVISTAILEIENIEADDYRDLPFALRILLTDDSNTPQFYDGILRRLYQGSRSDTIELASLAFQNSAVEEFLDYEPALNSYQADITLFIQAFLEGRVDLSKIWIYDPRTALNVSGWRTLKDNVKIKIYYTKSNN